MGRRFLSVFFFAAVLSACTTHHLFEPIPLRDADLYPGSQTKGKIAVAVDQVSHPQRVAQYFGFDLTKADVLPINIIVSNHGPGRYVIKPSDVLLMIGKEVIDPVPVKAVEAAVRDEYGRMSVETEQKVDAYFGKVMLQETVVAPHDNYQGIIFMKAEHRKGASEAGAQEDFTLAELFREGSLKLRVAVTDMETSERIHFGPFSLSGL